VGVVIDVVNVLLFPEGTNRLTLSLSLYLYPSISFPT
jgi:hypothetical protein